MLFIKAPEIFRPTPVFHVHQPLKCLTEIGHADAEYSMPVDDNRTGGAYHRRNILGDAAGADFSCHYRCAPQKTNF